MSDQKQQQAIPANPDLEAQPSNSKQGENNKHSKLQWLFKTLAIIFALFGTYLIFAGVDVPKVYYLRNEYIDVSDLLFYSAFIIIGLISFWVLIKTFNLSKKIMLGVVFVIFIFAAFSAYDALYPTAPYMSWRKPALDAVPYEVQWEKQSPNGNFIVVNHQFAGWEILSIKRSNDEIIVTDLIDSQKDEFWAKLRYLGLDDRKVYQLDVTNLLDDSSFILNIKLYPIGQEPEFEGLVDYEEGKIDISSLKVVSLHQ